MTCTIQFSPTELLLEIFKYLPRSTLFNCATVCRTWHAPAIQLFYENVELSEKTKKVWLHIVNEETPCTKNVGVFVKKLTVSLAFSTTMTQADFLKVLSYLPFVKSIDLNLSGYKLHYLAYLNKRGQNCVTYLEDINTGDLFTDYQMQQYFLCAYSFRHSLKNLTLRNPHSSYIINTQPQQQNQQATTVLSLIRDFENLNCLSVISDAPADNNELLLLMNSLQDCAKLTHFIYKNNYLQTHYPPNYDEFNQLQKKLLSHQPYQSNKLQTIELHLPILTEHYIKNILCSFPLHLNAFSIEMTHTDHRSWIQNCNELFGLYLGYVKHLKISISNINRRGQTNARRKATTPEETKKFWQFIKSIVKERQIFCQVRFTAYKSGSKPDLLIERDERHLLISYNSDELQDLHAFAEELSLMQQIKWSTSEQLSNSGVNINSMVVEMASQESLKKQFESIGSILSSVSAINTPQSILILFPNIAASKEERHCDSYIELGPSYTLGNCAGGYHNENQRSSLDLKDSSKHIAVLNNIDFNVIPLGAITSSLLFGVQSLNLIGCKNYSQMLCNRYDIDLADMKCLNQVALDLSFLLNEDDGVMMTGQQVLIKLDMLSVNQVAYYKLFMDSSICCITETNADDIEYAYSLSVQCQSINKIVGFHMGKSVVINTASVT